MIKRLNSKEYNENARQALLTLCGKENPNPFDKPFLKTIKHQVITMGGVPRREIMNAIKIIASELGDNGFYLHDLEVEHNSSVSKKQNFDWYVSFDEINKFGEVTLIDHIDYVYFSPNGSWGIVTSDVHCVIGGSQEFLEGLIRLVPDIQDDVIEFINYWRNTKGDYSELEINIDWLYPLLVDTYGLEESKKLIAEAEKMNKTNSG